MMAGPKGSGPGGPAPVLPAMGLHSFHNDSPPFSGATELPDQPDALTLSEAPHTVRHSSGGSITSPSLANDNSNVSSGNGLLSPTDPSFTQFHAYQSNPTAGPSIHETNRAVLRAGGIGAPVGGKSSPPTGQMWEKDIKKSPVGMGGGGRLLHQASQERIGVPVSDIGASIGKTPHITGLEGRTYEITDHEEEEPEDPDDVEHQGDNRGNATRRDSHHLRDDVILSASRSRRLVSGYLFGNPPSPNSKRSSLSMSPEKEPDPEAERRRENTQGQTVADPRLTTSTPINNSPSTSAPAPRRPRFSTHASAASSNRFIDDAGMSYEDNLQGVNDGEADADDSAPKAENGGSGAYMRKEGGEYGQYMFPTHRLRRTMKDETKIPLVIVACGSFSPPTYLHLRMFEMAKDEIVESQTFEIMAGYYSPVSSYYKKAGLAPAIDRVRMCELAVEHTSTWLMVDPWEAGQPEYQRTAVVLDHFDEMLNGQDGQGGVEMSEESGGGRRKYKVMLLAGGDLIESFGEPGVWSEPDLHVILGRFGCLIVERAGSDVWAFLLSHDILYHHRRNVIVIKQLIYNDISSTKVRLFVRRGMSIKYLLPNMVIQYIQQNKLYLEPDWSTIAASTTK